MERMRAGTPPRMTEREVEITALRRCGAEFPCALSVQRLETAGRVLFAASIRDLSELEAERKSRREVEALLRAVFDDQNEAIFRYDEHRRIVFYNLAACRLYGVTPTEMSAAWGAETFVRPLRKAAARASGQSGFFSRKPRKPSEACRTFLFFTFFYIFFFKDFFFF
jgi:PAS domain-containing protein